MNEVSDNQVKNDLNISEVATDVNTGLVDQSKAMELAKKLDVNDATTLSDYGADEQKQLSEFSQNMLNKVSSQDTGAIGNQLAGLMTKLNDANPEELSVKHQNMFMRLFSKVKQNVMEVTAKYQKMGIQIDTIAGSLQESRNNLNTDNKMMDELYKQNKAYFDSLNLYIEAAKLKQKELNETLIPEAKAIAEKSNNQMDTQKVNDLVSFENRLEKRTYDLETARQISLQQAPQIRMIQNTNQQLSDKIQSSINTAIPLWKNQVAIALTLLRQRNAVNAQQAVSETTNDLLKKNSEMLKMSSIETAKENERGIVDVSTLKQTQLDLVDTLKETLQIQQDGRAKRQEAEKQLQDMEAQLKQSLLDYTKNEAKTERKDVTDSAAEQANKEIE